MLELLGSSLVSLLLEITRIQIKFLDTLNLFTLQNSPGLVILPDPNPSASTTVLDYLKELITSNLVTANQIENQGIWIQSGLILMANHQGDVPLPAASLTKVATSLVAFKTWGPSHQFETLVSTTSPIVNGVLEGDLIVTGGADPVFISENAIALANTLKTMGIKQVKGNLVINGKFFINFQPNPDASAKELKKLFDSRLKITGGVQIESQIRPWQTILVRHHSLLLHEILKQMNVFSNNEIAEMLAESVGGVSVVQSTAVRLAGVPASEIQLINGSGLGIENRISPRAICAMLMSLQKEAATHQFSLSDLFLTSGVDHRGTIQNRRIPFGTVVKTGTLNQVSSLAGVMPTRDRGFVYFTILNKGTNITGFRIQQDKLLQHLAQKLHS